MEMNILSPLATKTFCLLIEKMQGKEYLKIVNEPFMTLHIERIENDLPITGYGKSSIYSLGHYYTLNGDMMRDPEMTFIVIEKKGLNICQESIILPRSFEQSDMGIYEESIILHLPIGLECNRSLQAHHTEFAEVWLNNIKDQRFLERL